MPRNYAEIPVNPGTRDRLRRRKTGGESYDDVLNRLLDGQPSEDTEVTTK